MHSIVDKADREQRAGEIPIVEPGSLVAREQHIHTRREGGWTRRARVRETAVFNRVRRRNDTRRTLTDPEFVRSSQRHQIVSEQRVPHVAISQAGFQTRRTWQLVRIANDVVNNRNVGNRSAWPRTAHVTNQKAAAAATAENDFVAQ